MMTIEDVQRLIDLPQDPDAPGFDNAAMVAGAALAMAAADNRGVRAALLEAAQMVVVGIAMDTDRPRATVDMLIGEISQGCVDLLALTGEARLDA